MSLTNGSGREIGQLLAQRLGLDLPKREGHDLAGPCIECQSSDAFRLHIDTGVGYCHSCQGRWSPYDVATTVLGDDQSAKDLMVELSLFKSHNEGNGLANSPSDPIEVIARQKGVTADALRVFGAKVISPTSIQFPCYGPDGKPCTTFSISSKIGTKGNKGMFAKSKPAGLFLPHEDGQVRLPQAGEVWLIVEGCKDAAALHGLGFLVVGLPGSSMNLKFARLLAGTQVILVPDRDTAGENGAAKSGAALYGVASSVSVATLPAEFRKSKGDDVRDVLKREGGRELLLQAIDEARPWEPSPRNATPGDDRPEIEVTPDEHLVNDKAVAALSRDTSLFQRGGAIVQILHDQSKQTLKGIQRPANTPRIVALREATLRERLSSVARFVKARETGEGTEMSHVHPPTFCTNAVAARRSWPGVRHLEGVISSPILRHDGSVLQTPGYDQITGLYYEPDGLAIDVPAAPTREEAHAAAELLADVVVNFPFAKPAHRSAWLAFVLTPIARYAFTGPSPLFLIDANVRASGKSLLADCASLIVTGRDIARMSCPEDDEETRKRITAIALNGDQMILIDNIAGELGSASLDAALTGTMWKDRILGRSEIVEMPLLTTWSATGNNVVLMADTSRRVCHIRLNSTLEKPEEREDFKHANLKAWVSENRSALLSAALTILSAYCLAGRPKQGLKAWGSFEGWSDLVRQAIAWVGMPDPGETREELARASDREAEALRGLISGWPAVDPDGAGMTAAKIVERLERAPESCEVFRNAVLELCPVAAGKLPGARSLGNKLRHLRGRVVGGKSIDRRESHGTAVWFVAEVGSPTAGGTGGSGCSVSDQSPDPFFDTSMDDENAYGDLAEADPLEQPELWPSEQF